MKFGDTFLEYIHGDQEGFLDNCSHVEYKRLKKVLKRCRNCKAVKDSNGEEEEEYQCQSCQLCDQMFFSELMKEASMIAGCFSLRVRQLLHLHIASGMQRYMLRLRSCFRNDKQDVVQEGRMLIEYAAMNAIAIRKILKKYDKVHSSANGKHFKSKMSAEHIEILQSPWFIELGAFYMNFMEPNSRKSDEFASPISCDLNGEEPAITLMLLDSMTLEYNLKCAICLDLVFKPYALSCGHLFCKSCACSAASVMNFQGLKAASQQSKCPVCREVGVYTNAVRMIELNLLVRKRCKEYWKDRLVAERIESAKQSREYWDLQTKYMIGY